MSKTTGSSFTKRLLLAFVKVFAFVFILFLAVAGGWKAYEEIHRSDESIVARTEANSQRIEGVADERDGMLARIKMQEEEIGALQTAVAAQNDQIADLIEALAAEQASQADTAASLTSEKETLTAEIAALNGEIVHNGMAIDALNSSIEVIQADLTEWEAGIEAANGQAEEMETMLAAFPAEEIVQMRQIITLFRISELISRTRLELTEENAGLAAVDLIQAMEKIDQMIEADSGSPLAEALLPVQERLDLAAVSLPIDIETAVRDLETARGALDLVLAAMLAETE